MVYYMSKSAPILKRNSRMKAINLLYYYTKRRSRRPNRADGTGRGLLRARAPTQCDTPPCVPLELYAPRRAGVRF